jgi:hypothetical protein
VQAMQAAELVSGLSQLERQLNLFPDTILAGIREAVARKQGQPGVERPGRIVGAVREHQAQALTAGLLSDALLPGRGRGGPAHGPLSSGKRPAGKRPPYGNHGGNHGGHNGPRANIKRRS